MHLLRSALAGLIALTLVSSAAAQQTMAMHTHETMSDSACKSYWSAFIELFPPDKIGTLSHPVSTSSRKAQLYFNQGLTFYYAFDSLSAMRSFHQATEADYTLAVAYRGVALAAGGDPNIPINDPCMVLAIEQSKLALRYRAGASRAENLYIDAGAAQRPVQRVGVLLSPKTVDCL